ncbi:hypothetical protein MUK42_18330 [Musa troglodytarum]|uniref:Uncharacterized protein n=1 Tax=Musa troglodytarum TaxID=320322 RepID=A0A9E7GBY5_9LILI|nr:hypothetical protein MUK42_18330 [Musa troglodytarum]
MVAARRHHLLPARRGHGLLASSPSCSLSPSSSSYMSNFAGSRPLSYPETADFSFRRIGSRASTRPRSSQFPCSGSRSCVARGTASNAPSASAGSTSRSSAACCQGASTRSTSTALIVGWRLTLLARCAGARSTRGTTPPSSSTPPAPGSCSPPLGTRTASLTSSCSSKASGRSTHRKKARTGLDRCTSSSIGSQPRTPWSDAGGAT